MSVAAYAVIDTAAIKHNVKTIAARVPHSKIMAIIKANAYGHGLLVVAEALQDTAVKAFGVARVDEGMQLRQAGFEQKITVLEGFFDQQQLNDCIDYDLDSIIHSKNQLELLASQPGNDKISVWLKLDVGMNRLGFKPHEFASIYQRLEQCAVAVKPCGLITHLSMADSVAGATTSQQIALFKKTVSKLLGEQSIANSAAIIAHPDSLTDWVRPGIMLYGISPFAHACELGLKPAMSLHSKLIAIKPINAGDTVGYAGTWRSQKRTHLGVVAIGYGDGYPRSASNGTPVLVNGGRVPLVGRVSMDMITVNLGATTRAKVGDPVTLWGKQLPVEEIAANADTIPYTLVCGVTQRVAIKKTPELNG